MSLKKALTICLLVFVLVLVSLFLINGIYPNWITALAINFLTVTVPNWISRGVEYVVLLIGSIVAVVAKAMSSIGNVKKTATTQVSQAQEKADVANSNVNTLLSENQTLTNAGLAKDTQITDLNTKLTEANTSNATSTQKIAEQEQQIAILKGQLTTLQDTKALSIAYANDSRVVEAVTPKVA